MNVARTSWLKEPRTWGAVLVILHLVGATGVALGHADLLLPLTPLNLVVCAGVVKTHAYGMVMKNSHSSNGKPQSPSPERWASLKPQMPWAVNAMSHAMNPAMVSRHAGQKCFHCSTNATRLSKLAAKGMEITAKFTHR